MNFKHLYLCGYKKALRDYKECKKYHENFKNYGTYCDLRNACRLLSLYIHNHRHDEYKLKKIKITRRVNG